jgi:hypothetical protein
MLKTVSSVANAIGALNYKGTWNATTNTPTLASGVGTQGDYYVVSVAGATDLNGITNWGIGDWATFNGSVWQRVEGGADGNFVNLDVTGAASLASLNVTPGISSLSVVDAANSAVSYPVKVSHLPGGTTGNGLGVGIDFYLKNSTYSIEAQVATIKAVGINEIDSLAERARLQGRASTAGVVDFKLSNGNVIMGTSGTGIDFSATAGTGTSELLDDYEEGTWTPSTIYATFVGAASSEGTYTKIGRVVVARGSVTGATSVTVGASGILTADLPFNSASDAIGTMAASTNTASGNIRTAGPFLVATDTISPVSSITFTVTYFT